MCHVQTCSDLNRRAEQNPGKTTCEHLRTMNYDERTCFGSGYSPATATLDRIWTPGPEDCHLAKGRFGPGAPTQRNSVLQLLLSVRHCRQDMSGYAMDMSCFYLLEFILPWGTREAVTM